MCPFYGKTQKGHSIISANGKKKYSNYKTNVKCTFAEEKIKMARKKKMNEMKSKCSR